MRPLPGVVAVSLLATFARAGDLHVPGDAPDIPSALALADAGDTIHVGPGTWSGPVTVLEGVRLVSDEGFGTTTIDGGAAAFAVTLAPATGQAELDGFTVVGGSQGRANLQGSPGAQGTLRRCRLLGGTGMGVNVSGGGTISDCLVRDNPGGGVRADASASAYHLFTPVLVERCLIEENGSPALAEGGGVRGSGVQLFDSVVARNVAQRGGGAAYVRQVDGSVFRSNQATVSGGALYIVAFSDFGEPPIVYSHAAFLGNFAPLAGGLHFPHPGFAFSPPHQLENCVLAGNVDDDGGFGLYADLSIGIGQGVASVLSCTFLGDSIFTGSTMWVVNTIVRDPEPFTVDTTGLTVSWSNIQGGWTGTGNFDADPLFVDAPHRVLALLPGSPCIDAGHPNFDDPDGSRIDVGALPLATVADVPRAHFGQAGLPGLQAQGDLLAGSPLALDLARARPGAPVFLLMGTTALHGPLKGGVLVPTPQLVVGGLVAGLDGTLALAGTWPAGVPSGVAGWLQAWIVDAAAEGGAAASNGVGLIAP